jgi:acetyl-CoA carboxylase biotin carboxyl carrier protein
MDLSQIRELLSVVAESDVEELTVEEDDLKITVRKSAPTVTMQSAAGGYTYPQQPPPQQLPPQQPPPQQGYAPQNAQPPAQQQQQQAPAPPPQEQSSVPAGDGASPAAAGEEEAPAEGTTVPAPIVGTFYRRPSPDDDPYVEVGDSVAEGDVLCIIEAMKLMNEIECETPGTIKEILVEDAEPVEYEQPLFVIEDS